MGTRVHLRIRTGGCSQSTDTHHCWSPAGVLKTPQMTWEVSCCTGLLVTQPVPAVFSEILLLQDWVTSSGGHVAGGEPTRPSLLLSAGVDPTTTTTPARTYGGLCLWETDPRSSWILSTLGWIVSSGNPQRTHHLREGMGTLSRSREPGASSSFGWT